MVVKSRYPTRLYTIEDGLSYSTVLSIVEDSSGFLWVGTFGGVNRFDGMRFKQYKSSVTQGLVQLNINAQGEFWIHNRGRGSARYDYERDTFAYPYSPPIPNGYPFREADGNLWILRQGVLYRMGENADGSVYVEQQVDSEGIGGITYLHDPGNGLLAINEKGIYRVETGTEGIRFRKIRLEAEGEELAPLNYTFSKEAFGDQIWCLVGNRIFLAGMPGAAEEGVISGKLISPDRPEIQLHRQDDVLGIAWDGKTHLYFRTFNGVYRMNAATGQVEWIYPENYGGQDGGEGDFQGVLYYDPEGILWAGTDRGLLKILVDQKPFHPIGTPVPKLNQVHVDRSGQLWFGSAGWGIFRSRPDENGFYRKVQQFVSDPGNPRSLDGNEVGVIFEDSRGEIYVSSGNAVQVVEDPLAARVSFRTVVDRGSGGIREDSHGWIYTNSPSGITIVYHPEDGTTYPFYPGKHSTYERSIYVSYLHGKWNFMLTGEGLYRFTGPLSLAERDGVTYAYPEHCEKLLEESFEMSYRMFVSKPDNRFQIWIYTHGRVLHYEMQQYPDATEDSAGGEALVPVRVKEYGINSGLSDELVYEIFGDDRHRIWLSTQNGLTCIDPHEDRVFRYFEEDGLPTSKLYWGYHRDRQGRLWLCTTDGLVLFHPDSIAPDPSPGVYLTGLRLFNEPVTVGPKSLLRKQLMCTGLLRLPHDRNFVSFEFAALDYTGTERMRYRYKMEGMDRDWVDAGDRRMADYPGLKPGKYRFTVTACNSNGVWSEQGASLGLVVTPPFWLRWYGILAEGLLLLGMLALFIRQRERNLRKRAAELERQVDEKTREVIAQRLEVDEMKTRFYTNISHEFRTPLTLLLGPIDEALKSRKDRISTERRIFEMMRRNARRLQRLINQLLEISKLESGKMKVQAAPVDLPAFARTIAGSFLSLAESRNIRFHTDIREIENNGTGSTETYTDVDKLEKILVNLLSNAFKYTPEGGEVTLRMDCRISGQEPVNSAVRFIVKDTGKGIIADQLPRIFDRFYHVGDPDRREDESFGIGLSLCKDLVELLRGTISVESEPGTGSIFTVLLPVLKEAFEPDELVELTDMPIPVPADGRDDSLHADPGAEAGMQGSSSSFEVLVVEDNPDLREYICMQLRGEFRVSAVSNGREGLEQVRETIPDLVVSDLMMPEMGGMEMSRHLKGDERTSHIPIIMLTARADKESKLEGLETGADEYITKPFDGDLLVSRVRNLVEQRRKLREKFRREFSHMPDESGVESPRDKLLNKIMEILERNMADPEYRVDQMTEELHMSRAQLFRKVSALTSFTPNELLRMMRLKRAARLFRAGHKNVSQVMYMVGFNNPSYFARIFRAQYGMNPSEFIESGEKHPGPRKNRFVI